MARGEASLICVLLMRMSFVPNGGQEDFLRIWDWEFCMVLLAGISLVRHMFVSTVTLLVFMTAATTNRCKTSPSVSVRIVEIGQSRYREHWNAIGVFGGTHVGSAFLIIKKPPHFMCKHDLGW